MGIRINGSTSGYTELTAPAVANNITLTLPDSTGSAGQALVSDGAGGMSWSAVASLDAVTAPTISGDVRINLTVSISNPQVAGGTLPYSYSYQWQFQASGGSSYSNISGATSQNYTIPNQINSVSTGNGTLKCVVTVSDSSSPALTTTLTTAASSAIGYNFLHKDKWAAGKLMYASSNNGDFFEVAPGSQGIPSGQKINSIAQANSIQFVTLEPSGHLYMSTNAQSLTGSGTFSRSTGYDSYSVGTQVACHRGHGAASDTVLYTDGSFKYGSNTIRAADSDPVVTMCGAAMVGHHPVGITQNGNIVFPGAQTWAGTGFSEGQEINPLPSGVKVIACYQAYADGTGSGYPSRAQVILGDDGKIYCVGNTNIIGLPTNGTWTAAAHATSTDVNGDFYLGICGDICAGGWSSKGGFAGITAEGKIGKATTDHAWAYVTDNSNSQVITDFISMPFGVGYASTHKRSIAFSATPNYIYRLDTATATADKYQINNLSGGSAASSAAWDQLKNGIGMIASNTFTSNRNMFILPT